MKIRLGILVVLSLTLAVLVMRNNERILDTLYALINPIKQRYIALTDRIESEGESYLMQKKTIDALRRENLQLHQKLLDQTRYLEQLNALYEVLPQLQRYAFQSVTPVHTVSYAKLHTFSRVVLTKPKAIRPDAIYGLIENDTVVGIAKLTHNQLYGYLLSDPKCRFAVYVGKDRAPGIAEGAGDNRMIIRYIPKWYHVKPGDAVVTSGLDRIFFPSLPVGTVASVQTQSAYKTATIRTLADLYHPKILFLIRDTNQTLIPYDTSEQPVQDLHEYVETPDHNLSIDRNDTVVFTAQTADNHTVTSIDTRISHEPSVSTSPIQQTDMNTTGTPSTDPHQDASSPLHDTDRHHPLKVTSDAIIQTRDDLIEPEPPIENKPPKPKHKAHRKKHRKHVQPSSEALDLF